MHLLRSVERKNMGFTIKPQRILCLGVLLAAMLFVLPEAALASKSPKKNEETCRGVGWVIVKCFKCRPSKKEMGAVAVLASYEKYQGEDYCVRTSDAKAACFKKYDELNNWNIGFYTKFSMGSTEFEEWMNPSCFR